MISRILSILVLSLVCAWSQQPPWPPPSGESVLQPKLGCADLRALTGYEFTVITAAMIPASADGPEYCRVTGQILPEIRFEVNLPNTWNRRFLMNGNGGYAGDDLDAPQRAPGRARNLRYGMATAATNTGHDASVEPLGSFAKDRQKLLDYAFRSLHTTAVTAKRVITEYYGVKPARSYYSGCSTGGRQGLIFAQRFPDDFDGIIAGAPVLYFSGQMMGYTCTVQALAKAPIPRAKLGMLSDRIYEQCDAKDGLKDGLIDDPRRCGFSPSRDLPKCADGADKADCFTSGQIAALEKLYGDVMSKGKRIFPGWPVGGEVADSSGRRGWDNWIVREGGQAISASFAETFFRYMGFPEKNPSYDLASFDFDRDPERTAWIHSVLDATDPDLSGFQKRGGKMIMYYGWADPALNAQMGVDYYESVLKRMGADTTKFFRYYMVPGMFHCGGGVGPSMFDTLTVLRDWVEKDAVPDRIIATQMEKGKLVRTRPLCPYPQIAKYKGSGSMDEAASFACVAPQ